MRPVTIRSFVDVSAPAECVFSVLDTPGQHVNLIPNVSRATVVGRLANNGYRIRYRWTLFGLPFSKELYTTDYVPNRRIVWVADGSQAGTVRWYFNAREDETRFMVAATCTVPGPTPVRVATAPFIRRFGQRSITRFLDNLRRHFHS